MTVTDRLKNEYVKQALRLTGVRKAPFTAPARAAHYRCPLVEAGAGLVTLRGYEGPRIPAAEWETLEYTTYSSDPYTYFAPITSPTGRVEMIGAKEAGKEELECVPTTNADKCPTIMRWLESMGARYGRVQLLRMKPNTLRECLWGLHQDNNNLVNPPGNGWIVRVWHELTDDSTSTLVVRQGEFARRSEVQVALPQSQQVVVDSERLWHGGFHAGRDTRYALIASVESSPALNDWIQSQLPTATARLPLQQKRTRSGLLKNSLPGGVVAVAQLSLAVGELDANREAARAAIAEAAIAGARLVVLPELSDSGYVFSCRRGAVARFDGGMWRCASGGRWPPRTT